MNRQNIKKKSFFFLRTAYHCMGINGFVHKFESIFKFFLFLVIIFYFFIFCEDFQTIYFHSFTHLLLHIHAHRKNFKQKDEPEGHKYYISDNINDIKLQDMMPKTPVWPSKLFFIASLKISACQIINFILRKLCKTSVGVVRSNHMMLVF